MEKTPTAPDPVVGPQQGVVHAKVSLVVVDAVQVSHEKGIPADIHPVVEITFPGETPDAKPTLLKVLLKHRC